MTSGKQQEFSPRTPPTGLAIDGLWLYGYDPCRRQSGKVLAMTTAAREDRIELRATKEEKRLLAAAAAY
jgi:hypothetical protein